MFRKQPPSSAKKSSLSQYGLLDMDLNDADDDVDVSDDDMDLEAELAAISGSSGKRKANPKKVLPATNLDAMVAASLRDIPDDDDDDVASGDEEDPDLLDELHQLAVDDSEEPPRPPRLSRPAPAPPGPAPVNSTVSLLQERISNYLAAESSAKAKGESSRARRFARGLKTLNDLLRQAKAGKPINDEDIPPPVSTGAANPAPSEPTLSDATPISPDAPPISPEAPPPVPPRGIPTPKEEEPPSLPEPAEPPVLESTLDPAKQQGLQIILKRQQEFKAAALSSKHAGDKALALEYLKVSKQFDLVVEAYKSGQEMDLSELPTVQDIAAGFRAQKTEEQLQEHAEAPVAPPVDVESGLITASSVREALQQRLAVFKEQESKAREQGNASKQRRMGRIVKQYEDAIKLHAAGKPLAVEELPTPPGYAPIPVAQPPRAAPSPAAAPSPGPAAAPARAPRAAAQATRADKQLALLLARQKEFKEAALRAKKSGNITQAKEYLRAAKGFDAVLEAARGGLAVDLRSLPVPPGDKSALENTFDIVSKEECILSDDTIPAPISADDTDVLSHLHQQLTAQLKLCLANRDHYKAMGNVAETNRFENLAVTTTQDLDLVNVAKRRNQDPPKFHYETRKFSIVQCNTDLNENDLELTIVRGIAYNVPNPKEVDTYVRFEFPYPQETPVSDKTQLVKDTNSPQYNAIFPLAINRGARPCQRVFKRHGIKLEVFSRGGWFSKDTLLGTVNVKLAPLETQVTLHEAFPLMDGRRPAGGSLEVKLRVRTPIVQQQFQNTTHRWLCIDS